MMIAALAGPYASARLAGRNWSAGRKRRVYRHAQSAFTWACAAQASHRGIRNESIKKSISSRTFGETCLRVG